jgi:hypothetical protein
VILTDLVVQANAWAAELVDQPGVQVATSTAEVMAMAERIASEHATTSTVTGPVAPDE